MSESLIPGNIFAIPKMKVFFAYTYQPYVCNTVAYPIEPDEYPYIMVTLRVKTSWGCTGIMQVSAIASGSNRIYVEAGEYPININTASDGHALYVATTNASISYFSCIGFAL